jgi:hypothetical protein
MTYIRRLGRLIAVDDDYVVQDGESVVTPSMFMDHDLDNVQRVYDGSRLHDGLGHPTGHKPGFVCAGLVRDVDRIRTLQDAAAQAYAERRAWLATAWRKGSDA